MNNNPDLTAEGFYVSNDPALLDIDTIHTYLSSESYWAKGITYETVERSVHNSYCFGVYQHKRQIGFARLITDKATFAYLADVFILPEYRGRGLSKWLMAIIQEDPSLQGLRRWLLATRDAHGLYASFGWKPIPAEQFDRFMQMHDPDVYRNAK
jgi:GNAT superfamily N-acetyltransferase